MTTPIVLNMKQGTPEWFEARRGVITGTRAQQLLEVTKTGKPTAAREDAITEMAMEMLGAEFREPVTGHALRRGHEMEIEAREAYGFQRNIDIQECGFLLHGKHSFYGCSPDGLVGDDGGVEFKSPLSVKKHVGYLLNPRSLFDEYEFQVTHCLYVSGRKWWDIVSYDPCNASGLALAEYRLKASDVDWVDYEAKLRSAYLDIEEMADKLREIRDAGITINTKQKAA